jgi:hypothetical protein
MSDVLPRVLTSIAASALILVLSGCNDDSTQPATRLDLEGLWRVTPAAGTAYGELGLTTLEFGASGSGSADFLTRWGANDITFCERHVYAVLGEAALMLDGNFYEADVQSADRIVLTNEEDLVTLDRVSGSAPVAPCEEAEATEVETLSARAGSFTLLNAVGPRLYFNKQGGGDSIVAYNTSTGVVEPARAYTQSVSGGTHRWVIGARTDNLFFGHCGCGGSTSVNYFNLAANSSIDVASTPTDLGVSVSIRYGHFTAPTILVGGRNSTSVGVNELLALDEATLNLSSRRQILYEAFVRDITMRGSALLALVDDYIVVVGSDGRSARSIKVTGLDNTDPMGITTIGTDVYLLAANAVQNVVLFEVAMP